MDLAEISKSLVGELRKLTETESVIGKPIQVGDVMIIPVSKLSVGFGTGLSDGKGSEGGSGGLGGGVSMQPLGFLVVKSDGQAELLSLAGKGGALAKAIEAVPHVVERIMNKGAGGEEGRLSSGEDESIPKG